MRGAVTSCGSVEDREVFSDKNRKQEIMAKAKQHISIDLNLRLMAGFEDRGHSLNKEILHTVNRTITCGVVALLMSGTACAFFTLGY